MKFIVALAVAALFCMVVAGNLAQSNPVASMIWLVAMVLFIAAGVIVWMRST